MKKLNKAISIIFDLILVILVILLIFVVYNNVSIKVNGKENKFISIFEVVSGSMAPTINIKDFIIVKNSDDIKVGDVVTYRDGKNFITHRVVEIKGDILYTKGDANNSDDHKIYVSSLIGKVILVIPKLGIIRDILLTPKVFISLSIFLLLLWFTFSFKLDDTKDSKIK